jgi:hypothetical protein
LIVGHSTNTAASDCVLSCRCAVLHQAIDASFGGNASLGLTAVVNRLAHAKACKGYASTREGLLLNGRFVLAQVCDEGQGWWCCVCVCVCAHADIPTATLLLLLLLSPRTAAAAAA